MKLDLLTNTPVVDDAIRFVYEIQREYYRYDGISKIKF